MTSPEPQLAPSPQEKPSHHPTRVHGDNSEHKHPQAIAHRGYCAEYPENTMGAFTAAVKAGAHAIETDMHLSKDGVVVLSHDATLKRCFGKDGKIVDYDWSYLSELRTLKEPHVGMPRFLDLLEYLASPGLEHIWLLLDIKIDNNLDDIMRLIALTIHQAPPSSTPWTERIKLGCWMTEYLPLCTKHLPGFPTTHIGFDLCTARQFLHLPLVSFTLLQKTLMGPSGNRFMRDARAAHRALFVWTVNERSMMRWSIRARVDGVVTDDVVLFLRVCEEYNGGYTAEDRLGVKARLGIVGVNVWAFLLGVLFRWRYGPTRVWFTAKCVGFGRRLGLIA